MRQRQKYLMDASLEVLPLILEFELRQTFNPQLPAGMAKWVTADSSVVMPILYHFGPPFPSWSELGPQFHVSLWTYPW